MRDRAASEAWPHHDVAGGGGKNGTRREYFFQGLPLALKQAILAAIHAEAKPEDFLPSAPSTLSNEPQKTALQVRAPNDRSLPAEPGWGGPIGPHIDKLLGRELPATRESRANFTTEQCLIADARLTLLRWMARQAIEMDSSLFAVHRHFVESKFPLGALGLSAAIANDRNNFAWHVEVTEQGISVAVADERPIPAGYDVLPPAATFFRWAQRYSARGWVGLAPGRRKKDMRPPAWAGAFLAVMQRPQKPSVAYAHAYMALPPGVSRPKLRTVQWWYAEKYSKLDRQRGRNTGSAINPYKFAHTPKTKGLSPKTKPL